MSLATLHTTEFWHGFAFEFFVTLFELQMQPQLTVACIWAFFLKPGPFKLPLPRRTCYTAPFLKLIWARWHARAVLLPPGLCVLHYHKLTTQKTRKENGRQSSCPSSRQPAKPPHRCSESLISFTGSGKPFFFNYVNWCVIFANYKSIRALA
jgi:hypothetical protein